FQQLEIDYVIGERNRELLPYASGVTREGHSVCCNIHGFEPYFYVSCPQEMGPDDVSHFHHILESKMKEANRNSTVPQFVLRIEMVQKKSIMYYQQQQSHLFVKIVVALPTMVAGCRGELLLSLPLPLSEGLTFRSEEKEREKDWTPGTHVFGSIPLPGEEAVEKLLLEGDPRNRRLIPGLTGHLDAFTGAFSMFMGKAEVRINMRIPGKRLAIVARETRVRFETQLRLRPFELFIGASENKEDPPLAVPKISNSSSDRPKTCQLCFRPVSSVDAVLDIRKKVGYTGNSYYEHYRTSIRQKSALEGSGSQSASDTSVANLVTLQGESQPFVRNIMTLKSYSPIVGADVMPFENEREVLLAWRIGEAIKVNEKCPDALSMLGALELKNDDWLKAKETFCAARKATDGKDSYYALSLGNWNYFAAALSGLFGKLYRNLQPLINLNL
ncbi:hypothetical protein IFM89_016062, partial [Coptis chinensis]